MTRKEEILNKAIEFVDKNYMDVGIKTTHEVSVAACQEIAEWADETTIEKACDFIAENMTCNGYTLQTKAKFIKEFRNYMKGE